LFQRHLDEAAVQAPGLRVGSMCDLHGLLPPGFRLSDSLWSTWRLEATQDALRPRDKTVARVRFAANRRSVGSAAPVGRAAWQTHGAELARPPVAQAHANASTLEITEPLDQWSSAMRTPVWRRAACRCNPSFRS